MPRSPFTLLAVSALAILAMGLPATAAAEPGVTLNPSAGDPPSASGNLAGRSWLCSSGTAPAGGATVSGTGVSGSATINRDGSLSGNFTVRGSAGQRVEVKVTAGASCPNTRPPVYLQATAIFTFNAPPPTPTSTRMPTATIQPTSTPAPTSTTVPPTPTARPTSTPEPEPTQRPTSEPEPTYTPEPTPEPEPTVAPEPTIAVRAEPTPEPVSEPEPTSVPASTATPRPVAAATATSSVVPSPTEARAAAVVATTTSTLEPTIAPTAATAVATSSITTPPAGSNDSQGSLFFLGCTPPASLVQVEFVPLGMWDGSEALSTTPSGPAIRVSTVATHDVPGKLTFQPPSAADAGRLYQVSPIVGDPQCPWDSRSSSRYWLAGAGKDIQMPSVAPGESRLEVSNNGDKPPIPLAVVKGAYMEAGKAAEYAGLGIDPPDQFDGWETQIDFYGSVEDRKQRFRWSTDLAAAKSAVLQVGMLPFPKGYEADPLSAAGILASWPVDCIDCEFVVDISPLPAPAPKESPVTSVQAPESVFDKVSQLVASAINAIGGFLGDLAKNVAGIFGGSKEPTAQPASKKVEIEVPSSKVSVATPKLGGSSAAGPINPLVFTTFYFRVLPLKDGNPAGSGSNAVIMHWAGASPQDIKVSIVTTPTPTPAPSAYETEIVSYHGVLPPLECENSWGGGYSYVVTQDAWLDKSSSILNYTTKPNPSTPPKYKKGDVLCEPKPKEPSTFEKVVDKVGDWVSGAWNWVSEAYSDLKAFAVDIVLKYTPLGLQCQVIASQAGDAGACEKIFATALDAALVTMGIPPDIPNLDQMMDQGLDYVASYMTEQAMAQVGVPPELTQGLTGAALEEAKQKFQAEVQAKIKQGLQDGVTQLQLSYADSAGWLPKGVPVRPNDYQPAGMAIKVSRKYGVPGGEAGCTVKVYDSLAISQSKLDNIPQGYLAGFKDINDKQAITPGKYYDPFVDLTLPVPPLAPGGSVTIPMSFKPNVYKSGWNPWGSVQTTDYFKAWGYLHMLGDVHLAVYGCGSASLDVAASGTYGAQQ